MLIYILHRKLNQRAQGSLFIEAKGNIRNQAVMQKIWAID